MSSVRKYLTAVLIGAATIGGVFLPTATAVAAPATPVTVSTSEGNGIEVFSSVLTITSQLNDIIGDALATHENRRGYVKSLREGSFYAAGQRHNILVIRWRNDYTANLNDIVYDAKVSTDGYPAFRVVVFGSGTVVNRGDGGYENWAFRGWFTRDGGTVNFQTPNP